MGRRDCDRDGDGEVGSWSAAVRGGDCWCLNTQLVESGRCWFYLITPMCDNYFSVRCGDDNFMTVF